MSRTAGVALVLLGAAVAHANGPTRKVTIDSDPEGATVYFDNKESTPVCEKTPCTIDAPVGDTDVIVELAKHTSEFKQLSVPAKRDSKPMRFHVDLKPAIGTLVIKGTGAAAGASIEIEGEDKGKAPTSLELPEAAYHVVVKANGKTLFDDFVEVESGKEATVTPRAAGVASTETPTDPTEPTDPGITKPAPPQKPHGQYVRASGAFDVGFRKFTYDGNMTPNTLRTESEGGQVLAGPMLELWPTEILGLHVLPGLSLLARFEFGVNSQAVTGEGIVGTTTTFWQSFEISLRHRWVFADQFAVEVGGGYVRDTYRFNGAPNDIMLVPDAQYSSVRLGVRGAYLVGAFEPYIVLENRIVIDGGALGNRFALGSSVNGLHAALGAAAHFGHFDARFEAAITDYSWSFKPDAGAMFVASGGSDLIEQLGLSFGYSY